MTSSTVHLYFAAGTLTYGLGRSPQNTTNLQNLQAFLGPNSSSSEWSPLSSKSNYAIACLQACEPKPYPVNDLLFLASNQYIYISFKVFPVAGPQAAENVALAKNYLAQVILRIYLVPYDLAGMQGRLQRRSVQKVVKPALRVLPCLLDNICRLKSVWQGLPGQLDGLPSLVQPESLVLIPKAASDV